MSDQALEKAAKELLSRSIRTGQHVIVDLADVETLRSLLYTPPVPRVKTPVLRNTLCSIPVLLILFIIDSIDYWLIGPKP